MEHLRRAQRAADHEDAGTRGGSRDARRPWRQSRPPCTKTRPALASSDSPHSSSCVGEVLTFVATAETTTSANEPLMSFKSAASSSTCRSTCATAMPSTSTLHRVPRPLKATASEPFRRAGALRARRSCSSSVGLGLGGPRPHTRAAQRHEVHIRPRHKRGRHPRAPGRPAASRILASRKVIARALTWSCDLGKGPYSAPRHKAPTFARVAAKRRSGRAREPTTSSETTSAR